MSGNQQNEIKKSISKLNTIDDAIEDIRKGIALTLFEPNSGQRSLNHGYLGFAEKVFRGAGCGILRQLL